MGVCGVAMAQVAAWLKSRGFKVTGSDQGVYPPMSGFLHRQGIEVLTPYRAKHIQSVDTVVVGNAVSRGNPEVETALNKRLPLISLPELIHTEILSDKLPIVVAGTHGKTTITAALAHILQTAGFSPGYLIGGLPIDWDSGFAVGDGSWFVIEGDEYDSAFFDKRPKFLHYQPQMVLLNNVEFDHGDIYNTIDEINLQFRRLIQLIPGNGGLIYNADEPNLEQFAALDLCPTLRFGRNAEAEIRSEFLAQDAVGMTFQIRFSTGKTVLCRSPLWGEHQLSNLVGAAAAAEYIGVPISQIAAAIESFKGVQRRLELKYSDGKRWLYEDFAHHPTAIQKVLSSIRLRHPHLPVFVALEPRSNTMVRRFHQNRLGKVLELADRVVFGALHRKETILEPERLDVHKIIEHLQSCGKEAIYQEDNHEVLHSLLHALPDEVVIVIMSNGSFDGLTNKVQAFLDNMTFNSIVADSRTFIG
ncbi:MAG: Mur ligase family protein [bacterium]